MNKILYHCCAYFSKSHSVIRNCPSTGCVFIRVCSHSRILGMFRYLLITQILCVSSYMSQSFSAISVQSRSASCFNTTILSTHKLHSGGNLKKCWKAMNRALLYYQWSVRLHHPTHDLFTHTHTNVHAYILALTCLHMKKKKKNTNCFWFHENPTSFCPSSEICRLEIPSLKE